MWSGGHYSTWLCNVTQEVAYYSSGVKAAAEERGGDPIVLVNAGVTERSVQVQCRSNSCKTRFAGGNVSLREEYKDIVLALKSPLFFRDFYGFIITFFYVLCDFGFLASKYQWRTKSLSGLSFDKRKKDQKRKKSNSHKYFVFVLKLHMILEDVTTRLVEVIRSICTRNRINNSDNNRTTSTINNSKKRGLLSSRNYRRYTGNSSSTIAGTSHAYKPLTSTSSVENYQPQPQPQQQQQNVKQLKRWPEKKLK